MALGIAELQQLRSVLSWSWLGRAKDAVQSLNSLNEPILFSAKTRFLQKTRGCTWLLQVAGASWLIISTRCLTLRRAATSSTVCTDRNTPCYMQDCIVAEVLHIPGASQPRRPVMAPSTLSTPSSRACAAIYDVTEDIRPGLPH